MASSLLFSAFPLHSAYCLQYLSKQKSHKNCEMSETVKRLWLVTSWNGWLGFNKNTNYLPVYLHSITVCYCFILIVAVSLRQQDHCALSMILHMVTEFNKLATRHHHHHHYQSSWYRRQEIAQNMPSEFNKLATRHHHHHHYHYHSDTEDKKSRRTGPLNSTS